MSDFIEDACPPVVYEAFDGTRFQFSAMLRRHWKQFTADVRAGRMKDADDGITADAKTVSYPERVAARELVRANVIRTTNIDAMMHYARYDADGVEQLLRMAVMDAGTSAELWDKYTDVIPMPVKLQIADTIVYAPTRPVNPQKPPQVDVAGGGQNEPATTDSTGPNAPITSDSPALTPTT